MNKIILALILFSMSTMSYSKEAANKEELASHLLTPILEVVREGRLYKASLPFYNQYRESKGKSPLSYQDLKPLFDKTAVVSEKVYIEEVAKAFSLQELQFLQELFSTKAGKQIMSSITSAIRSGNTSKPDFAQLTDADKKEFEAVASKNSALAMGFGQKMSAINVTVQKQVKHYFNNNPEFKNLINK